MSQAPLRDSYEGLYGRAQNQLQAGDVEGAITTLRRLVDRLKHLSERVLHRRPDLGTLHLQARMNLVRILAAEARYAEAIEAEEVLLETHPDETSKWRRDLAVLRAAKGEVNAGLSELEELAKEAPDEPGGWVILGVENRLAGKLADSQTALDRALEASKGSDGETAAGIHYQHFLLYKEMRQLDEALTAWEELLAIITSKLYFFKTSLSSRAIMASSSTRRIVLVESAFNSIFQYSIKFHIIQILFKRNLP